MKTLIVIEHTSRYILAFIMYSMELLMKLYAKIISITVERLDDMDKRHANSPSTPMSVGEVVCMYQSSYRIQMQLVPTFRIFRSENNLTMSLHPF